MTDEQVIERLRSEATPWFDGITWRKNDLAIGAMKLITRQQAALAECHKEIFKLRDALASQPSGSEH